MKIFLIILMGVIISGCGNMKGLLRQDQNNFHKLVKEGDEIYYNSDTGHNHNVKMTILNENTQKVQIPIRYVEDIEPLPAKRPESWNDILARTDFNSKGDFNGAEIERDSLTFLIKYNRNDSCVFNWFGYFLLSPIYIPLSIAFPKEFIGAVKESCYFYPEIKNITIKNPWDIKALEEQGIIATFDAYPSTISPSCQKKFCVILDDSGNIINEIVVHKKVSIDHKKVKAMLQTEKEERIRKEREEIQRQIENERFEAKQKKECPVLYRTLYLAQHGYYLDPIVGMKNARRFEELNCGFWLNAQLNRY